MATWIQMGDGRRVNVDAARELFWLSSGELLLSFDRNHSASFKGEAAKRLWALVKAEDIGDKR